MKKFEINDIVDIVIDDKIIASNEQIEYTCNKIKEFYSNKVYSVKRSKEQGTKKVLKN